MFYFYFLPGIAQKQPLSPRLVFLSAGDEEYRVDLARRGHVLCIPACSSGALLRVALVLRIAVLLCLTPSPFRRTRRSDTLSLAVHRALSPDFSNAPVPSAAPAAAPPFCSLLFIPVGHSVDFFCGYIQVHQPSSRAGSPGAPAQGWSDAVFRRLRMASGHVYRVLSGRGATITGFPGEHRFGALVLMYCCT